MQLQKVTYPDADHRVLTGWPGAPGPNAPITQTVTFTCGTQAAAALAGDVSLITSFTLNDRGDVGGLDLTALTNLIAFNQDNGGGSYLHSFPMLPTSVKYVSIQGGGYGFNDVDASALVNLETLAVWGNWQIGYNGGTITLPNTTKLTFVNFGNDSLTSPQVDSLLIQLATYSSPTGCTVYVDGYNSAPGVGDRDVTGPDAIQATDWQSNNGCWSQTIGSDSYTLYSYRDNNWNNQTGAWIWIIALTSDYNQYTPVGPPYTIDVDAGEQPVTQTGWVHQSSCAGYNGNTDVFYSPDFMYALYNVLDGNGAMGWWISTISGWSYPYLGVPSNGPGWYKAGDSPVGTYQPIGGGAGGNPEVAWPSTVEHPCWRRVADHSVGDYTPQGNTTGGTAHVAYAASNPGGVSVIDTLIGNGGTVYYTSPYGAY